HVSHLMLHAHFLFSFAYPAPPETYTLSLHDALPISSRRVSSYRRGSRPIGRPGRAPRRGWARARASLRPRARPPPVPTADVLERSEEHTSELQSLAYLVCRLLLEKKKNNLIPHQSVH